MKTLPEVFEERLSRILPERQPSLFAPRKSQTFRINTLKVTIEAASQLLAQQKIDFKFTGIFPYAIRVDKPTAQIILKSKLASDGILYAQGLESMVPVMALDPQPGQRVLDLCAAPGSKTSQIAMLMNNEGQLTANEPVRERFFKLKSVLSLTGTKAKLSSIDGRRLKEKEGPFDRILVDAPCSSEGRFKLDEPKSFAYWSLRKVKEMSHKQKGLLLNASRLLAPGGALIYSTCTFAPEENEEVLDWFLRKTEGFSLAPIQIDGLETYPTLKSWLNKSYDQRVTQAVRILPNETMDGFFIAKLLNSHYKY